MRPRRQAAGPRPERLPFFAEHGRDLIDTLLSLRAEPEPDGVVPHALIFAEDATNG